MTGQQPDFDPVARAYRWMEYLTLGQTLQRCRLHFLPCLNHRTNALILGDGDGRFLARLLEKNPLLRADAVDTSATMLSLLSERCQRSAPSSITRLKTHHADALTFLTTTHSLTSCDLVATHFFLDCLTQQELAELLSAAATHLSPGAVWLLSDFRIPDGLMHLPAVITVRSLYFAFRILTGLRVTRLPDHQAAFAAADFTLCARHLSLCGLLTTELWTRKASE